MDFQIVGVFFLAALSLSLGAYMSPFNREHYYYPPEARASTPLSCPCSDIQITFGHVPASEFTKRRRISGLNSRFDRMLWEASLTARPFKSLSRRHKLAYSSSSSSISNSDLASTSTHASNGAGEPCFVVGAEEIQSHKTMQQIDTGLSQWSNNGDQVLFGSLTAELTFDCFVHRGVLPECTITTLARQHVGHSAA